MSGKNTFTTQEDLKIQEIISKAFSIKDQEERAIFVEDECGGNEVMYEYVMESLDEMIFGEPGVSDSLLEDGAEVGNYIIIEKINQGGIASVYRAEHKVLKTLAAIKIFDRHDSKNIENDLFWNTDHSSLAKFNHDNIIKLYDVGKYEKNGSSLPYIAVEFVKGKHLDDHCESKPFSIRELLNLFQDLCEVIEFVHNKGNILHLDLKPDNILITADRPHRIKLIDFGSSKLSQTESKHFTRWDLINPLTLKFAPPEQFDQNEVLTNEADVYSLGVILYLLITGKVPLGEGIKEKVKITREIRDMNLQPVLPSKRVLELEDENRFGVPLKTLNQILSGDLDSIIMKALAKRRRDRYQSVSEFRRDIDNFLKGKPVKAKRKDRGYKTIKSFSQILGFKGGLVGWEKWKSPIKRFSVAALLLTLVGSTALIYSRNKSSEFSIGRRIENPPVEIPINAYTQTGATSIIQIQRERIINMYCGSETQEELCFTFIQVPRGAFTMGIQGNERFTPENYESRSNPSRKLKISGAFTTEPGQGEGPLTTSFEASAAPHEVTITNDLYMAKFEITNRQWNIVAEKSSGDTKLEVTNNDSSLPKTDITYGEAVKFCKVLTAELKTKDPDIVEIRLPSEAEWEYACRADVKRESGTPSADSEKYNREAINAIILSPRDSPGVKGILRNLNKPWPESSLLPNTYGLVGMNGNVWEIIADAWHDTYEAPQKNEGGTVIKNGLPDEKPRGNPVGDQAYVIRGGAYNEDVFTTQCSYRKASYNSKGNGQIGFRVVMIRR